MLGLPLFGGGRGSQLKHGKEFRRVTQQGRIALADAMQEIEVLGLRELLRFCDTFVADRQLHGLDAYRKTGS